jgi:EpsI family protein
MTLRLLAIALTLTLTGAGVQWVSRPEPAIDRAPLHQLADHLGEWQGHNLPIEPKALEVLGVSDHVSRVYASTTHPPVSLYIGYYGTQRTGQTIHSPMKCLPGNGWQPIATGLRDVAVDGGTEGTRQIRINRYIVQNGLNKHVVLFWYQMRGQVVSSEYVAKLHLMDGALRTNRTDGAIVRVIVPVSADGGEREADAAADKFVRELFPKLGDYLPA